MTRTRLRPEDERIYILAPVKRKKGRK
jgi:hypothetical protein